MNLSGEAVDPNALTFNFNTVQFQIFLAQDFYLSIEQEHKNGNAVNSEEMVLMELM
jgi:hypothetical protein